MPDTPTIPRGTEPKASLPLMGGQPPSFRRRLSSATRAWARDTFSKRQLISSLKSLAWVAPLTILIWIYAEREQLAVATNVQVTVDVKRTVDDRIIRVLDPTDRRIRVDFTGPKGPLDTVREQLESGSAASALSLPIDPGDLSPGEHEIGVDKIGNDSLFLSHGMTVTNYAPRRIRILVDPIEVHEIEVQAPADVKNLASPAVFDPRKVRVRLPHSLWLSASQSGEPLVARADLAQLRETKEPGAHDLTLVQLNLPSRLRDPEVTYSPTTVSAHIEVKNADATTQVAAMPVWVMSYSLKALSKYDLEYDQSIPAVMLIGPEEQIRAITDNKTPPHAYFVVLPQDLQNPEGDHEAPLKFDLPPEVRVAPGTPATIKFKVTEKTESQ